MTTARTRGFDATGEIVREYEPEPMLHCCECDEEIERVSEETYGHVCDATLCDACGELLSEGVL